MAVAGGVWWLGPLDGIRALPSPSLGTPPDATPVRTGGVHRSLTGRPTLDRLGVHRTWVLGWPYLDADTRSWLTLLHAGLLEGPLWLLDPSEPNRLPRQIATTGGVEHAPDGFRVSAGHLTWAPAPLTPPATPRPVGSGALKWTVPESGGRLRTETTVPLLPGDTVTLAATATAAAASPVHLTAHLYDGDGAPVAEILGEPATPGSDGARLALTVIAPPGAVAISAGLETTAAGTVTTSAWSLTPAATAPDWTPGGGAAVVLCDALAVRYPVPGSFATTLTLLEV